MGELPVVRIDRHRWLRGEVDSYLIRPRDNKMCCVGFYAVQHLKATKSEITGFGELGEVRHDNTGWLPDLGWLPDFADIYSVNDREKTPDQTRERVLTEKFAALPGEFACRLEFFDGEAE